MKAIGWDSLWVALGLLALGLLIAVALHNLLEIRQHRKPGESRRLFSRVKWVSADHDVTPASDHTPAEEAATSGVSFVQAADQAVEGHGWNGPTRFEVSIEFECLGRMPEATLDELRTVRRIGSKPVRCIEGPGFHQACLAIALAGRSGFLNLLELDEFSARVRSLQPRLSSPLSAQPLTPRRLFASHVRRRSVCLRSMARFNSVL